MTTTTSTRNTWPVFGSGKTLNWRQTRTAIQTWRKRRARYKATVAELHALGPRELADIGIAAADIERIAREDAMRV